MGDQAFRDMMIPPGCVVYKGKIMRRERAECLRQLECEQQQRAAAPPLSAVQRFIAQLQAAVPNANATVRSNSPPVVINITVPPPAASNRLCCRTSDVLEEAPTGWRFQPGPINPPYIVEYPQTTLPPRNNCGARFGEDLDFDLPRGRLIYREFDDGDGREPEWVVVPFDEDQESLCDDEEDSMII